jgi:protein-L-isoaspartate(D-aspartate) O-methyltransferase
VTEDRLRQLRSSLVDSLRVDRSSPCAAALDRVFRGTPRHCFVPRVVGVHGDIASGLDAAIARMPEAVALDIYSDRPLPLRMAPVSQRSTSSAPGVMWTMLAMLRPSEGQRILEVGTGSGYNAALLGQLVGAEGRVVSVECISEIAADARECLRLQGSGNVDVLCGDGTVGWDAGAPYDGVIVTAAAPDIQPAWFGQLREGGRLVVVLDGLVCARLASWQRVGDTLVGGFGMRVSFVPIVSEHANQPNTRRAREALGAAWRELRGGGRRPLTGPLPPRVEGVDTPALLELMYGRRAGSAAGLSDRNELLLLSRAGDGIAIVPRGLTTAWGEIDCLGGESIDRELRAIAQWLGTGAAGTFEWLPAVARPIGSTAPLPFSPGGEREFLEYCALP